MSIASEISRISGNVQNTIDTIEATGVTVPEGANSDNLPSLAQALANTKQDKLTGAEGQVVGFDSQGNAIAQDAPSGLPSGGTPGQLLSKTESGTEWVDKPTSASTTVTLTTSGWTGDAAPYSQQVACSIVAADTPVVSVDAQTSGDPDANAEILNAWALVSQKDPMQGAGTMTFYATEKPTVNIPVKVGVS